MCFNSPGAVVGRDPDLIGPRLTKPVGVVEEIDESDSSIRESILQATDIQAFGTRYEKQQIRKRSTVWQ